MVDDSGLGERTAAVQGALAAQGMRALFCRQPENLVMLAGYWPVIGRSAILLPADGAPILFAPEMEREALARTFIADVRTFPVWKLEDPPPEESLKRLARDAAAALRLGGTQVGAEQSPDEDLTPTQKVTEPWFPARPAAEVLAALGAEVVDASPLLREQRARKTGTDLGRLRIANEIARFGIRAFYAAVDEGRTEAEVAADVERAIVAQGSGHKGTIHARGEALVFSGVDRLFRFGWGFAPTTARRLERGDLVMLELSTVADGYYSDLTRMATVGSPSAQQQDLLDAVAAAQQAAVAAVRPGVSGDAVDRAAREVLRQREFEEYFIHLTGHGLGFRYHEGVPLLYPGADGVLAEGMVTSIEPGIYARTFGGVRIEENVAVTGDGAEVLSA
ncbi:MAG TPA: Xaa-Pro peptidase family protein [bacterium]|jgi:Xaa-Pro dipeptidase|nr:Xaa-Pro peptidase family protein [bacterium]